jgi:membrane-associated phospholipid phosphatase
MMKNGVKENMLKDNIRWLVGFTAVVIILLGILSFGTIDYDISNQLINRSSVFGWIFNVLGELPANLGLLLGTAILFGSRKKGIMWRNVVTGITGYLFMVIFALMSSFTAIHYIYEFDEAGMPNTVYPIILGFAAIFLLAVLYGITKIGTERLRDYRRHALLLILVVVSEILIVNVLKIVWSRPRMRMIDSIDQFRYWYQINGPMNNNEYKSFPSGHAANGFVMLAYTMFISTKNKKLIQVAVIGATLWGVMVAISRIIMGAHFLSDVIVGGYITILIFYVLKIFLLKKKEV